MASVSLDHGLVLAAILFAIGFAGLLTRRNLIVMLACIEIMLNAAGLAFVVAGARWGQADGQVMFLFVLAMAAAEVAVGLAARHPLPPASLEEPRHRRRRRDEGLTMLGLLWLIPALPAAGFVLLTLLNRRLSRTAAAWIGAGSVGLSALVALLVCGSFIVSPPAGDSYHQVLWTWFDVAGFAPTIGFYLDAVSVLWVLVITFVGFLIHLYSTEHMEHDEGFTRFFMYMNLFVASMLVLVLADNLLLLYLGWEGVGLCSYLLIAFWQKDPQNVYSGRKAFIVTRVGDTALIVGLFLLFTHLHTLQIQPLLAAAQHSFVPGSAVAVAAALLILGGAVGKSAQLPLQTWLPDAMAGPSPVSALIHAATMVTAGVYLIARTNVLFTLAPDVRLVVAIVGTVTLLFAGFSALVQHDIKRALAYSTISQIGYMFLALGVVRLGRRASSTS